MSAMRTRPRKMKPHRRHRFSRFEYDSIRYRWYGFCDVENCTAVRFPTTAWMNKRHQDMA